MKLFLSLQALVLGLISLFMTVFWELWPMIFVAIFCFVMLFYMDEAFGE